MNKEPSSEKDRLSAEISTGNEETGFPGGAPLPDRGRFVYSLLDSLKTPVVVIGRSGDIMFVNRFWRESEYGKCLIGRDFYAGENYFSVCANAALEGFEEAASAARGVREVIEGKLPEFSIEYACPRAEKKEWFQMRATRCPGPNDECFVIAHENITDRALAENLIRQFESRYRSLFDSALDAIFVSDLETMKFLEVNDAAARSLGYARSELLELTIADIAVDPGRIAGPLQKLIRNGSIVFEHEHKRKDGSAFPVQTSSRIVDHGGRKLIQSFARDLSDRKRAEEAVRAANESLEPGALERVRQFEEINARLSDEISIRRQAEDSLEKLMHKVDRQARQLDNMLSTSPDHFYMYDRSGVYTYVSREGAARLGTTREELLGKHWRETPAPPPVIAVFEENHRRVESTKKPARGEVDFPTAEGHRFYEFTLSPALASGGGIEAFVVTVRDVTQRRRDEAALRASDERFRQFFNNSPMVMTFIDLTGKFVDVNESFCKLFGYSRGELLGMSVRDLTPPEYMKETLEKLGRLMEGEIESFQIEKKYLAKDGGIVQALVMVSRLDDEEGAPKYFFAQLIDVSERKRAEAELQLAAHVFETAIEGVVITDPDAIIQWVNPAVTTITGYSAGEMIGKKTSVFRSNHHDSEFYRGLWSSLATTGQWQGEIWNRRKDGEVYVQWQSIMAIRNEFDEIVRFVSVFHDLTELHRSKKEVKYQAHHDALTGLPNRRLFTKQLNEAIKRAERSEKALAVLFIDVDNFKHINDSHGHLAGDKLLEGLVVRLVGSLREVDIASRFGGDEFTIFVENMESENDATKTAQRVMEALSEPFLFKEGELIVTVSVGIALFPSDGETSEALMNNADTAMHYAKDLGRNNYQMFNQAMNDKAVRRLQVERDLRTAIDEGEIVAYYQPKVDLASGRVSGMEALVRWRKRDGEVVSPAEFMPLAEETGLIVKVDELMIHKACQFARSVNNGVTTQNPLTVSVNLSAKDLERDDLVECIVDAVQENGIKSRFMELEVTESAIIRNVDRASEILGSLRGCDFNISIDDFGTGYSSLNYVTRLPINIIKIDRAFIRDLTADHKAQSVARAIILMAHELGMSVVAEGVETLEQLEFLRSINCDTIQGYLFSPPLPEDRMLQLLGEDRRLDAK